MLTELDPNMRVSDLTLADLEQLIEIAVAKALAARQDLWDSALACMLMSESSLAEDWNSPEETEAWADLQKVMLS